VILDSVDENDKPLIEELVLHMKSFVSDFKEKFSNFELQKDDDRYIVSAQFEGTELTTDELCSIQSVSQNNVSVIFNDSKLYCKAFLARGSSKNLNRKMKVSYFHWGFESKENLGILETNFFWTDHYSL
jgi:hypothetical protein